MGDNLAAASASPSTAYQGDKGDVDKGGHASLGAHLSLIALTVFLSFGVSLVTRYSESGSWHHLDTVAIYG
jgi:hypothetical protein